MKLFSLVAGAWTGSLLLSSALARGFDRRMLNRLEEAECNDSTELLGDLLVLKHTELSPVSILIKNILQGNTDAESDEYYRNVHPLNSAGCARDTCCVWWYIVRDMERLFRNHNGQCTNAARAAIRLGFHDAAGWSKNTGPFGGADGSIVLAPEEAERQANQGLKNIIQQMKFWYGQWNRYGVGMADLVQMAATVATVVCPLGPRIRSFVGRLDSSIACEDGLLPNPFGEPDDLIDLFRAKTIQPHGLAALLGAHSTSRQRFVDETRPGSPQDSTPGVWDVLFYKQTLGNASSEIVRFPSDVKLAKDRRINDEFKAFTARDGQEHWNHDYAREYVRVSLLGVYNINNLTDCTSVLPAPRSGWAWD